MSAICNVQCKLKRHYDAANNNRIVVNSGGAYATVIDYNQPDKDSAAQ